MARRAAGEGSIYRTPRGYAAMLDLGYVDGKRKRKKFEGKTRTEVARKLAEARRQLEQGGIVSSRNGETLRGFVDRWLVEVYAPSHRPKSTQDYKDALKLIPPHLGRLPLAKVTGPLVQRMVTDLGQRYAPATVALLRRALRQALEQARQWHLISHNPAEHITCPKIERRKVDVLSPEQARALLAVLRGHRLAVAVQLAVSLGLRRGEVCGLRWEDIDFESGVLHIRGSLQYVAGQGLVYGETKTASSRRSIKLPAALLAALRWHQQHQKAEREHMGWKDSGYVFVAARTGGPLNGNVLIYAFKEALERAGIAPIRFHDLRHSCASFLIAQGVHAKVISGLLGHTNISITMDLYGHLLPDTLSAAAEQVADLLEPRKKEA